MIQFDNYIRNSLSKLNYFFTRGEIMDSLCITAAQFKRNVTRLIKTGVIKRIKKDCFMIVPVEYSSQQSASPLLWVIEPLAQHLKVKEYYVGLLSSAFLHGALNHEPHKLQVLINKLIEDVRSEDVAIEFHVFKEINSAMKDKLALPIGKEVSISSKEQTIIDLIRFHKDCGYLGGVIPVIKKLAEACSLSKFSVAIVNEKNTALLQRLGHILEFLQLETLASIVEKELSSRKMQYISLRPDLVSANPEKRNERFRIVVNDSLGG